VTAARCLAWGLALACASSPAAAAKPSFPGDDVLALAGARWERATLDDASRKLRTILARLKIDRERAARYGDLRRLKFVKTEKPLEIAQLSNAVLIAKRGAKIGTASRVTVIAEGEVEIGFATAVFVVASGPIRIAHEMPEVPESAGIYVTKSTLAIGHARDPVVYAVGGANVGHAPAFTAYNTEFQHEPVERSVFLPQRLFGDEPVRKPAAAILKLSGHPVQFTGRRCRAGLKTPLLEGELDAGLRSKIPCGYVESAAVRCERDEGSTGAGLSVERWTLQACGQSLVFVSQSNPYTRSVVEQRKREERGPAYGARQAPLTSLELTDEEKKEISRLFKDAFDHTLRGDIVSARAKYAEVLKIAPDHRPALQNSASLDTRIARADAAVAPFTALIDAGRREPRIYADRGLAYLGAGDVGRGLADLDAAAASAPTDEAILLDRIDAYLRADRPADCVRLASDILTRSPRLARAYALRAWCHLVENRGEAAFADARASLEAGAPWTPESFARQKAGYRVIAGYLALLQTASEQRAKEWVGEWRGAMTARSWPDAFAQYVLGELDYDSMREVAAALKPEDRGNALGEATVFAALQVHLRSGTSSATRSAMTRFFRQSYAAGRTLAWVLYQTLVVPNRLLVRREP